jgi:hypothetical protein
VNAEWRLWRKPGNPARSLTRHYSPLARFFDKSWQVGEIEPT